MILHLSAKTDVPDMTIDYIEIKLQNGTSVSLSWDESEISRNKTGFDAKYKGICFGEEYANGRIAELEGCRVLDVGLYSETEDAFEFKLDNMLFVDNDVPLVVDEPNYYINQDSVRFIETEFGAEELTHGFKSVYNFKNHPERVCYVPEEWDFEEDGPGYTGNDILEECGHPIKADIIFSLCSWQHPSTVLGEWDMDDEKAFWRLIAEKKGITLNDERIDVLFDLQDSFAVDVKKQHEIKENTTAFGEPQAFLSLDNGRSIEVTLEQEGLKEEEYYYTIRLHCNEVEYANDAFFSEIYSSNGVVAAFATPGLNPEDLKGLIGAVLLHNEICPVVENHRDHNLCFKDPEIREQYLALYPNEIDGFVRDWYIKNHPYDLEGLHIDETVTFNELITALNADQDFYKVIGIEDSMIRENVFKKIADILDVDYQVVYDKWISCADKPNLCQVFQAEISISSDEVGYINQLLGMTGDEIYDKYGLKEGETITHTIKFENGYELDVKVVICSGEDKPYIDLVLFDTASCEVCCDTAEDLLGEIEFEVENMKFIGSVRSFERSLEVSKENTEDSKGSRKKASLSALIQGAEEEKKNPVKSVKTKDLERE